MKIQRVEVNGVLLLNKSFGSSSNQILQIIKRAYNAKKAGHTGTLDPMATGLLPICFGEATKFAQCLLDSDKEYIATIKLGETTTTYDAMGDITACSAVTCSQADIQNSLRSYQGLIWQIPPIYSALKVAGKPLYEYARSGEEVSIKSRQITIFELEILKFVATNIFKLRVRCSKGTYIRTLAHDIGQTLGCGAHLIELVRTKTAGFALNEQLTLDHIMNLNHDQKLALLLPPDVLVQDLPRLDIDDAQYAYIQHGHAFKLSNTESDQILHEHSLKLCHPDSSLESTNVMATNAPMLRLYFNDIFLGIARVEYAGDVVSITPVRLLTTAIKS